jgi:hypothetical protein
MDEGLSPRPEPPRRPIDSAGERFTPLEHPGLDSGTSREGLVMQVLATEHFSLLTHRSLAYNEAFTRVGMFLTFVSMSFVALALLSTAMDIERSFLVIAAIVLGFDVVIGATTAIRIGNANTEDLHAVQAMARIRHGYLELAPEAQPYFTAPVYDDVTSVLKAYTSADPSSMRSNLIYGLSTSGGMLGFVLALVSGAFGAVAMLAVGAPGDVAFVVGVIVAIGTFVASYRAGYQRARRNQASMVAHFPRPTGRVDD